jgi:type II secretory pathway pseudopilin PulG
MNTLTRQWRSGFTGIEILVVVIILVILFARANSTKSSTGGPQSGASNQVSGTAQAVKESALAGSAVIHVAGAAAAEDSTDAASTADPAGADLAPADAASDADSVDGLDDILDGIFESL